MKIEDVKITCRVLAPDGQYLGDMVAGFDLSNGGDYKEIYTKFNPKVAIDRIYMHKAICDAADTASAALLHLAKFKKG